MTDRSVAHWQRIYAEHGIEDLSWTESVPACSLALVQEAALPLNAAIIEVGGGASRLASELLGLGYGDVTVADISAVVLGRAKADLGKAADRVKWIEADAR